MEHHSLFGSRSWISRNEGLQKLYFKDIGSLKLGREADGSVKLVAEYAYDPSPTIDEAFGLKLFEKRKRVANVVIVDLSWGFEKESVKELYSILKKKVRHACSESETASEALAIG